MSKAEKVYIIPESEIKKIKADALDELIAKLEEVDDCWFASFTLCLIKEKAEELKNE